MLHAAHHLTAFQCKGEEAATLRCQEYGSSDAKETLVFVPLLCLSRKKLNCVWIHEDCGLGINSQYSLTSGWFRAQLSRRLRGI
jgi:hypothetical protein